MSTERSDAEAGQAVGAASETAMRIAVVGGGLAGLTAAFRLTELAQETGRPIDVTLFEASDRLGGAIETVREGDYLVERGADSFLTTKPAAVRLCERLGLTGELLPTDERYRGTLVLRAGKPMRVPDGFNLMTPAKVWPVLTSPILSPAGKLRLFAEAIVPARKDALDESLGAFVRRRFGREAFERLVQPLVSGIYTADPELLSLAATLPRFPEMERRHGSLIHAMLKNRRSLAEGEANASGARYGAFAGLRSGMEQFFGVLRTHVRERAKIVHGARVTGLRHQDGKWLVEGASPGAQTDVFDAVIVATPAHGAADLLSSVDADLTALLRGIPYASSAIVLTAHRLDDVSHPLDAFGLVIPAIERRDVLAVSFASRKFPGRVPDGRVLLRTFVGGATRPEILDKTDAELVALVRKELASLLGVSGTPDLAIVSRHDRAMPQYHIGHLDRIRRIEVATAKHPGLELAGSAYRGVGIPDVVADAERAAEALLTALANYPAASYPT